MKHEDFSSGELPGISDESPTSLELGGLEHDIP
jgi:hypothetical protein